MRVNTNAIGKAWVAAAFVVLVSGIGCSSNKTVEPAPTVSATTEKTESTGTSSSTTLAETSSPKKANLGATSSGNSR